MNEEAIHKVAEETAKLLSESMNKPLGVWDFLNIHRWIIDLPTLGLAIYAIYRCAVFVVKAKGTKRELKMCITEKNIHHENEKNLQDKLNKYEYIEVIDGLAFFRNDTPPRYPLCPSCMADGVNIRMLSLNGVPSKRIMEYIKMGQELGLKVHVRETIINSSGYTCPKCGADINMNSIGIRPGQPANTSQQPPEMQP